MFTTNSRLKSVKVIKITGDDKEDIDSKARLIAKENGYLAFKLNKLYSVSKSKQVGVISFFDFIKHRQ